MPLKNDMMSRWRKKKLRSLISPYFFIRHLLQFQLKFEQVIPISGNYLGVVRQSSDNHVA